MANGFSGALAAEAVRYFFTADAPVINRPGAWYVGLCKDADAATEFAAADFASYARKAATFAMNGSVATLTTSASWVADAGSTPPPILSVGVYDAPAGGNLLAVAAVPAVTWAAGESAVFAAGSLTVQVI